MATPVRASVQAVGLCVAGLLMVALGVALNISATVAWGCGLWLGVGLARALTVFRINTIRQAGFDMVWLEPARVVRAARNETIVLKAEIRNHDSQAVHCQHLKVVADSHLKATLAPTNAEIPPQHSLVLEVHIEPQRVGRYGIHGLTLEVSSGPQLFSVPLSFPNPLGVEVMPHVYRHRARSALGGRSRRGSPHGLARRRRGEGGEFSEIREHQVGDPFKRIAWRASARRGKLLVRDYELQEHEVVWLVLDASVELWAGLPGSAPLDHAIDELASLADHHLAMGDSVGLIVTGARVLSFIAPESKPTSLGVLLEALAFSAHTHDADRSGLSEFEAASWVLEHMAPTAPLNGTANGAATQVGAAPGPRLDQISALARTRLSQGPFAATALQPSGQPSSPLRQYLAAFGISSPARLQQDRVKTDHALCAALDKIAITRPRATRLYLCSPTPDTTSLATMQASLLKLPRRHVQVTWVRVPYEHALDALEQHPPQTANADTLRAVTSAVKIRMQVMQEQGEKSLRRLGVKVQPVGLARRAAFHDPEL